MFVREKKLDGYPFLYNLVENVREHGRAKSDLMQMIVGVVIDAVGRSARRCGPARPPT